TKLDKRTVEIVGGGLTAALVARQLTAKGTDVLVLERGYDRRNGAEAKLPSQRDELRWDTRGGLGQNWSVETYTFRHASNEEALPARRLAAFLPGDGLGGAGNHWNGFTWRWSEYDPTLRTRLETRYGKSVIPSDLLIQDWGVTYADMEPYHHLFEKLFGISGKAGNIKGAIQAGGNPFEAPRRDEYPQPPLEATEAGLIFKDACEKIGYKPFIAPSANSSGAYTNPDGMKLAQCQYCGHCEKFICEAQAKATAATLLYPLLMQRKNFEIRLQCRVTGVDYDASTKRASAVRYVDMLTGEEFEQPADVVVLASFTMSNTRFLLMGGIGRAYDPATAEGVVGKNFCYQTTSGLNVFVKNRWINPFLASGSTGMTIDEFNGDNFDHSGLGFVGGAVISANVMNGRPINSRHLPPNTPQWGTQWKQASADWYAHSFGLQCSGSSYPHRQNYVSLDPDYRDALGEPLARITFDWRDNDMKMSEYCSQKVAEIAKTMNTDIVTRVVPRKGPFDTRAYQSTHITGGTPMGTDPKTSVVSNHLQHWDAENLFVVGASVFPHNSGYNPTGMLSALALRLGDELNDYIDRPRML
ncbi:MAG TPA: GMC family oxidoreductase, partial [Beijerinckiaceae bacterium]|nr:GMC family oxidoreductase [Beijerinckiaceae bacterium]